MWLRLHGPRGLVDVMWEALFVAVTLIMLLAG